MNDDDLALLEGPSAAVKIPKLIACAECRKRKRKCNKQNPCSECTRRGVPHLCQPDFRRATPNYASVNRELGRVRQRLAGLEAFIAARFPEYKDSEEADGENDEEMLALDGLQHPNPDKPETPGSAPTASPIIAISRLHSNSKDNPPSDPANDLFSEQSLAFAEVLASFQDFDIFQGASTIVGLPTPRSDRLFPSIRQPHASVKTNPWSQQLIAHLLTTLPPLNMIRSMSQFFFDHASRIVHGVMSRQFFAEIGEFESMLSIGQGVDVDPAWLALLFVVMSMGLVSEYEARGKIFGVGEPNEILHLAERLAECSKGSMAAAQWTALPNLRIVQTLTVSAWLAGHLDPSASTFEYEGDWQRTHVTIALAHCRAFGLDRLGTSKEIMPKPDPALGSSISGFRRQMALRIWQDYKYLENLSGCYLVDRKAADTARPALCRDEDLAWSLDIEERSFLQEPFLVYKALNFDVGDNVYASHELRKRQRCTFAEAEHLARQLEHISQARIQDIQNLPHLVAPENLGSTAAFCDFVRMNQFGGTLRIYRAALYRCRDVPNDARKCESEAKKAAVDTVACLTSAHGPHISRVMPLAVSFLLNACVLLLTALRREKDPSTIRMWLELLKSAHNLFGDVASTSRSRPIVAKSRKAAQVVANFAQRLFVLEAVAGGSLSAYQTDLLVLTQEQQQDISPGGTSRPSLGADPSLFPTAPSSPLLPQALLDQLITHQADGPVLFDDFDPFTMNGDPNFGTYIDYGLDFSTF